MMESKKKKKEFCVYDNKWMVGCVVLSWVDGMITWFAEPKRWIITWFARCETKVVNYYFILEPRI